MRPECAARGFAVRRCVPKLRAMTPPTLPACVLEHRSSADLEPALRHAAWQEIAHRWVDFRPAPEVPLEAELTTLSSGVCTLGATRSSAYEMRTGARRGVSTYRTVGSCTVATASIWLPAGAVAASGWGESMSISLG